MRRDCLISSEMGVNEEDGRVSMEVAESKGEGDVKV